MYDTSFRGMNGEKSFKNIKKPSDLYKIGSEIKYEKPLEGNEANKALLESGLVKQ